MKEYDIGIIAVYRTSSGAEYREIHCLVKHDDYIHAVNTAIKEFENEFKDWIIIKTFWKHLTKSQLEYIIKETQND